MSRNPWIGKVQATSVGMAALLLAACAPVAAPQGQPGTPAKTEAEIEAEVAKHYDGKTLTITVGFGPGGGYDTMTRMVAVHIPKYIPGKPQVVVTNMPGAATLTAGQHLMKQKADGTQLATLNLHGKVAVGGKLPGFDGDKVEVIGTAYASWADRPYFCTRTEVATTWEEVMRKAQQKPLIFSSPSHLGWGVFLEEMMHLPVKGLYSYAGATETEQAVDQKEVEGTTWCHPPSIKRKHPDWVTNKFVTPVIDTSCDPTRFQEYLKEFGWKQAPCLEQVLKVNDHQKKVIDSYQVLDKDLGYLILAPPGVPDHILAALRKALKLTSEDPAFKEDMTKRFLIAGFRGHEEVKASIAKVRSMPPEVIKDIKVIAGLGD